MHEKSCRQTGGTLCGYLLAFPFLSFRLFCFTLSQPFLELPLAFFTFVVGEDVRENTPGDVLDFVLRNTGIVYELLLAAQVGCSLRFGNVKSYAQNCLRLWWKSITGGGLTAPWLLFSKQGANGQGRRYAARLALDHL